MGCSLGPMEFVFTAIADNSTGGAGNGLFNPFTGLVPSADFDRIRATIEVLAFTPECNLEFAGRGSTDGVTFTGVTGTGDVIDPSGGGTALWYRSAWLPFDTSDQFLQFGVSAWRKSSVVSREMATLRVRLEFKCGT